MSRLADYLSRITNTDVIDETGLRGRWDFIVIYAGMQPVTGDGVALPPLSVALEDKLGLTLERVRRGVDVLIVKQVHPLIEN